MRTPHPLPWLLRPRPTDTRHGTRDAQRGWLCNESLATPASAQQWKGDEQRYDEAVTSAARPHRVAALAAFDTGRRGSLVRSCYFTRTGGVDERSPPTRHRVRHLPNNA